MKSKGRGVLIGGFLDRVIDVLVSPHGQEDLTFEIGTIKQWLTK